jgi:hypothetical protein
MLQVTRNVVECQQPAASSDVDFGEACSDKKRLWLMIFFFQLMGWCVPDGFERQRSILTMTGHMCIFVLAITRRHAAG